MRIRIEYLAILTAEQSSRLGNIGYLKFDVFADPDVCGPTAVAAMNFLGNTDAIIFDLRENGGGDPKMVALSHGTAMGQNGREEIEADESAV